MLIKRLARIESLTEVSEFPKGTATIAAEGTTFGLPLAGIIDVAEERARLEKSLEKLAKEIGGLRAQIAERKKAAQTDFDAWLTNAKAEHITAGCNVLLHAMLERAGT